MNLHNILLAGFAGLSLVSCSDYLDVDAPSKIFPEYAYSNKKEINRALNGVYAALNSDKTYASNFLEKFCFNTDVDFKAFNNEFSSSTSYQRYDCDADASDIKKAWDALYQGVERANMLDAGIRNSEIYDEDDAELMQILGEVKVMRAIFYHDLVWYWGDVPFSLKPSYEAESVVYDVVDRTEILKALIDDLKAIAPKMTSVNSVSFSDGVERISKEMAWAMIARLSMTAAGYSLRPDGSSFGKMECPDDATRTAFFKTAAEYCDSVIERSNHDSFLSQKFHEVFVTECNLQPSLKNGDVIFEIPFGKESSGNIGYIHGPKMDNSSGVTVHNYGKASGSAQLNAFYRYFFDEEDVRRDYINQMFGYNSQGEAILNNGRTVYNGKWSKLWNTAGLGAATEGSTGINYPYMRYADVLLMSAEAENEINGAPTAKAMERLELVRKRAFPTNEMKAYMYDTDYDGFKKAVLNERMFEFAGENMRWRDLVRNNMLNENVYWTFFRYYNIAYTSQSEYGDYVGMHDFNDPDWYNNNINYSIYYFDNIAQNDIPNAEDRYTVEQFPNQNVNVCWIRNLYRMVENADRANIVVNGETVKPSSTNLMDWSEDDGFPKDYFLYSTRGYIYSTDAGEILINENGNYVTAPDPSAMPDYKTLPAIRYILPYPRSVITRSMGKYVNQYGYK